MNMKMTAQTNRYLINSVLRATQILESFSSKKTDYTNVELSRRLGLNKSTVTRLLYSLESAGFLERDIKTGAYRLTYKLYRIGSVYIKQAGLYNEAKPIMTELASLCKETVHLAVLERYEVAFIDWIETPQQIGLLSLTGMNLPAYCTSAGKVLLAYFDKKHLDNFFQSVELRPYTTNTITDPEELKRQLSLIREKGYSVDNTEFQKDVKGVACPIRDKTGKVLASVSVAGPAFRMNKQRTLNKIIGYVMNTAQSISRRLGYLDEKV